MLTVYFRVRLLFGDVAAQYDEPDLNKSQKAKDQRHLKHQRSYHLDPELLYIV
jgi:hypothetical protein